MGVNYKESKIQSFLKVKNDILDPTVEPASIKRVKIYIEVKHMEVKIYQEVKHMEVKLYLEVKPMEVKLYLEVKQMEVIIYQEVKHIEITNTKRSNIWR